MGFFAGVVEAAALSSSFLSMEWLIKTTIPNTPTIKMAAKRMIILYMRFIFESFIPYRRNNWESVTLFLINF